MREENRQVGELEQSCIVPCFPLKPGFHIYLSLVTVLNICEIKVSETLLHNTVFAVLIHIRLVTVYLI